MDSSFENICHLGPHILSIVTSRELASVSSCLVVHRIGMKQLKFRQHFIPTLACFEMETTYVGFSLETLENGEVGNAQECMRKCQYTTR